MKTAWYIDKDKNIIQITRLMLKLVEYEMRSFSNAHDTAQALLAGERPDIIILDINAQEELGIDLLEFVRKRKNLNPIPVIMLASENGDDQFQQAISAGADGFVLKPIMLDDLENTIQNAIEKRVNL
ncbi:MAG: response regulator [Chloroflexota bacterium]